MGEDEYLFNDDILNDELLEVLVKQESQYINTQSNKENDINNTTSINSLYGEHQQQTSKNISPTSNTITVREPENGTRSNWEPMDITDHVLSQQQGNSLVSRLQNTIDHLESRLRQEELDQKSISRKLSSMQTILVFKEQELESMRAELKESKKKIQPNEKEWMDIDQEDMDITMNNNNNTDRSSNRKNLFPSVSEFNMLPRQKRQRTISTSPSLSSLPQTRDMSMTRESSVVRESSVMREQSTIREQEELEHKQLLLQRHQQQQNEDMKINIDKAVKNALTNHKEKLIKELELKQLRKDQQEIQDFYRCLLTVNYLKHQLQDIYIENPIQLSSMADICEKLTHGLRPSKITTETDSKFDALITDLSDCILQAAEATVKSTLVQILDILKLLIKLCVGEKKSLVFVQLIQILYTLAINYKDATALLYQEMIRYEEESLLYTIVKGFILVPLYNNDDGHPDKSHIIHSLPDLKTLKAKEVKAILKEYHFGPSDKRLLLTNINSSQAQETVVNILDIISCVCCTHMMSAERFLFLLDQNEFISLISTRKPYSTSIKALTLLNVLIVYGSSNWLYKEKYRPLLKMIASFMILPRPSDRYEVQWYKARFLAITIFETIISTIPLPISFNDTFDMVFTSLLYILNNECLCIQNSNKPPYHSVPTKESDQLLIDAISLMSKTLAVYPDILDCEDGDVYIQTLAALKRASTIINEKWSPDHEATLKIREIGKLLHKRRKIMMES